MLGLHHVGHCQVKSTLSRIQQEYVQSITSRGCFARSLSGFVAKGCNRLWLYRLAVALGVCIQILEVICVTAVVDRMVALGNLAPGLWIGAV